MSWFRRARAERKGLWSRPRLGMEDVQADEVKGSWAKHTSYRSSSILSRARLNYQWASVGSGRREGEQRGMEKTCRAHGMARRR